MVPQISLSQQQANELLELLALSATPGREEEEGAGQARGFALLKVWAKGEPSMPEVVRNNPGMLLRALRRDYPYEFAMVRTPMILSNAVNTLLLLTEGQLTAEDCDALLAVLDTLKTSVEEKKATL